MGTATHAAKVAKPLIAAPPDVAQPVARQETRFAASKQADCCAAGASPPELPRPGHDFSRIRVHAARAHPAAAHGTLYDVRRGRAAPVQQTAEPRDQPPAQPAQSSADAPAEPRGPARAGGGLHAAITYTPVVARGGVDVDRVGVFGVTEWNPTFMTNGGIKSSENGFELEAEFYLTINWDTRTATGFLSKTNITSENDTALTDRNYKKAAADLTPNMAIENGQTPAEKFWCRDLVERHELFHVEELKRAGQHGVDRARAFLEEASVTSKQQGDDLIIPARKVIVGELDEVSKKPAVEERAYGAIAPAYCDLAYKIETKGDKGPDKGGYPDPK